MQTTHHPSDSNLAAFILGAFINLVAVADWSGLGDYAIKAIVGGFIWLLFKVIGDMISHKILGREAKKEEQEGGGEDDDQH